MTRVVTETSDPAPRTDPPKLVQKLQAQRETHKDRHPVVRGAFVLSGMTLLVGGVAMLLLPGPAFVVIPIGLALLSLEFCWAGRLLDKSLVKADDAKRRASEASRTSKVLTASGVACAAVAAVVVVAAYNLPGPL
jgi:uncharacterized protein (TIGR02611 family)